MHILLYHPPITTRVEDISYDTINYSSGVSGTETAMMELVKYLADHGHRVTVLGMVKQQREEYGVLYLPDEKLAEYDYASVDVFCPVFYVLDPNAITIYNRLPRSTIVWVMAQCYVRNEELTYLSQFFKVIIQCVSPWLRSKYLSWSDTSCKVIENAIHPMFTAPLQCPIEEKAGRWVFHASYERGGDVALRVFEKVRAQNPTVAKELHVAAYYTPHIEEVAEKALTRPYLYSHGSLSKEKLRDLLDQCEYFVYPLVLPQGLVHHDTYGCVVLEAMARGVIVITWDVACYESVYNDRILRIDTIPYTNYDPKGTFGANPMLQSEIAIDYFVTVINYLEQHPDIKEDYRKRAMEWARTQLWENRGNQLVSWLQENVSIT